MSYETKTLLRDANGVPIPQYWDDVAEEFKPMPKPSFDGNIEMESSPENPVFTQLTGSIVKEATAENIIVAAGASKYIDIVFSSKVSAISIAARTTGKIEDPKFMWALANGTTTTINLTVNELPLEYASSNNSFQTKKIDALNNKMRIQLNNTGSSDVTVQQLTIRLYGANMDNETATFTGM